MLYMCVPVNIIIDVETNGNIDDVVKRCEKITPSTLHQFPKVGMSNLRL